MHLVDYFFSKWRGAAKGLVLLLIISMSASYLIALKNFPDITQIHVSAYGGGGGGGGGSGGGGGGGFLPLPTTDKILSSTPEEAAELLEDFEAERVARKLSALDNKTHVAYIMGYFDTSYGIVVLREFSTSLAGQLHNMMREEPARALLMEMNGEDGEILESMTNDDFNSSVKLVETAIKHADGLNETERTEALQKLGEVVGTLDKPTLVRLLISMSGLPDTPTTTAHLISSMNPSLVIDVVDEWASNEAYSPSRSLLVNILGYLDSELIDEIYGGVTDQTRLVLLETMPEDMKSGLPVVGNFSANNLKVSSAQVEQGEALELEYVLENQGGSTDDYLIPVKINGVTNYLDEGILASNESITLTHGLDTSLTGSFVVEVLDQTIEYKVTTSIPLIVPTPFELSVISIEVLPEEVERGEDVIIFTTIINMGETAGTSEVELLIDSLRVDSKEVYLEGGDSITLSYKFPAEYDEGTHRISMIEAESEFNVLKPPFKMPWFTIITVVVILAIVVYNWETRR